jgi:hypothetical protein
MAASFDSEDENTPSSSSSMDADQITAKDCVISPTRRLTSKEIKAHKEYTEAVIFVNHKINQRFNGKAVTEDTIARNNTAYTTPELLRANQKHFSPRRQTFLFQYGHRTHQQARLRQGARTLVR